MAAQAPGIPPRISDRAQAQRERILAAAQKCFIEHGFHAAGMALIADTAGMSPGLIYRYFDGKNAIILAIIERHLEESRSGIRALHQAPDFAAAIFEVYDVWRRAGSEKINAALFLEMTAEATRVPVLAEALRASDLELRNELCNWLSASAAEGGKGLPADIVETRALSLQCFIEGLTIRAIRSPNVPDASIKAMITHYLGSVLFV